MRRNPQVAGHWHALIEGFATSSEDFYGLVKAGIDRRKIPNLKIKSVTWKQGGPGSGRRVYLRVSREGLNFDICAAPFGTGFFFSWWLAKIPRILLDILFLILLLFVAGLIAHSAGQPQEGQSALQAAIQGCAGALLMPIVFLGVLFLLGLLVRHGETGLEPTVLSMPITSLFYRLVFRPNTYFNEDTALMFRESVHNAVLEAIDQVTSAQGIRALAPEARRIGVEPGR